MKNCELCKAPARTYCESDQASLCWECDGKVHGANFLVTRHSRTLLCHSCQSLTPWKASGAKLGNTISLCESCAAGGMKDIGEEGDESEGGNDDDIDTEDDLDDDGDDDDEEEDDGGGGDEDGDNQVVPLSASTPPPPASNSSSSEESISRCNSSNRFISETASTISLKRKREDATDLNLQDDWKWWCKERKSDGELKKQVALLECEDGEGMSEESPIGTEIGPATTKGSNEAKKPEAV